MPVELALRRLTNSPRYQSIAAEAAGLHEAGVTFKAIAECFGVDDHTAAKAVRWFRR